MLSVIGQTQSRTFRVLWCLEELGLPYEQLPERPHSKLVKSLNPLGQVPILKDGDKVMTDSLAILYHLSDRAGKLTYSAGSTRRARMDARINFALGEMEAPLWLMARHSFVLPETMRHPEIKPWLRDDFALAEAKFETLLGDGEFFGGDRFTIADIIVTHIAGWAINAKVDLTSKALSDYMNRMRARPAYVAARKDT